MSVQSGFFCYADAVGAGKAACAAHVPSSVVVGGNVVTLSCSGVSDTGDLIMQTSVAPVDGSASGVISVVEVAPAYGDCTHDDIVQAGETVAGAVGAVVVLVWSYRRLAALLAWGRGEAV